MDIAFLGEQTIEALVAAGLVTDSADQLGDLPARKLVDSIHGTKGRPLSGCSPGSAC